MYDGKMRFAISVTPELQQELEDLEHSQFQNTTRGEMLRVLIQLGLDSVHEGKEAQEIHTEGK